MEAFSTLLLDHVRIFFPYWFYWHRNIIVTHIDKMMESTNHVDGVGDRKSLVRYRVVPWPLHDPVLN